MFLEDIPEANAQYPPKSTLLTDVYIWYYPRNLVPSVLCIKAVYFL